ncbi:B-(1-6) glucan synthase [Mycena venus]|uniref:glucan endo-1,3-beta-D-glucosidase n=1 Tax=Mycena venus TaxID=2733690 RepID=A0A8H6WX00_9AGAR|nr:B-(1-6) glucan synthase [Mycena venus]
MAALQKSLNSGLGLKTVNSLEEMAFLPLLHILAALCLAINAHPLENEPTRTVSVDATAPPNCFPALGFKMPSTTPLEPDQLVVRPKHRIWVRRVQLRGQSLSKLRSDFLTIRNTFNSRYIRMYGACDRAASDIPLWLFALLSQYLCSNDIVDAAWGAGIGVHALIWFGFDGTNQWMGRRDSLFGILHSNPKAKFVTRVLQFGSEPLFDGVLDPTVLAQQVTAAKKSLSGLQIPVTISEMAYGYQEHADDGSQDVMDAIQLIDAHMLPFFSTAASTAKASWPIVLNDLNWFIQHGQGKKIYLSQNGWPSVTSDGVQPNSPSAVANVQNEHDYYSLLDAHCEDFKAVPGGGVGWFWHIYSDEMEPGYGLFSTSGKLKFSPFNPKTSC